MAWKNHQIGALRYRMAQVNDLQNQREELRAIAGSSASRNDILAFQIEKVDSSLHLARTALHHILGSFPEEERARVLREFGAEKLREESTATLG